MFFLYNNSCIHNAAIFRAVVDERHVHQYPTLPLAVQNYLDNIYFGLSSSHSFIRILSNLYINIKIYNVSFSEANM